MNLFKALVLALVLSNSLAAMQNNDNTSNSDIQVDSQTDYIVTSPSSNK